MKKFLGPKKFNGFRHLKIKNTNDNLSQRVFLYLIFFDINVYIHHPKLMQNSKSKIY